MTPKRQEQLFIEFAKKQLKTLCGKRSDYATEDALSNFKQTGAITGVSSAQVALMLIGVKVARLGNLLSNNKTNVNESIDDSVLDLANYAFLLKCILVDNNESALVEAGILEEEDFLVDKEKVQEDWMLNNEKRDDAPDDGRKTSDVEIVPKKVKCIDNKEMPSLEIGKVYEVLSEVEEYYHLDINGEISLFFKWRFQEDINTIKGRLEKR